MDSRIRYNLKNQIWLITGSSRGIGRSIAVQAAEAGAKIAVHYNRNETAARQTLSDLRGNGHHCVQADMQDPDALEGLMRDVTEHLGGIDVLVNNAGTYDTHNMLELDFPAWRTYWNSTVAVNLTGPAHLCFLAAKQMKAQGGGRIINISSRGAYRGEPNAPAYGAGKAGLNALTQSLAQALAEDRIFVYGIAPGFVETDMTSQLLEGERGDAIRNQSPLGRTAQPEEIADAVLYLASGKSEYMTGAILDINGASYLR